MAVRSVGPAIPRRRFVVAVGLPWAAALLRTARPVWAQAPPVSAGPAAPSLVEDLVAANRILADQGVLDGYGHVSARHDRDPGRYLLARSRAPELIVADDFIEYDLDSNPADARGRSMFI